jgi:hypothetical protein
MAIQIFGAKIIRLSGEISRIRVRSAPNNNQQPGLRRSWFLCRHARKTTGVLWTYRGSSTSAALAASDLLQQTSDVGGPLFFHGKSFPKAFNESTRVPDSGFVVLSHWDFDHYSLAVSKIPKLRDLDWYAPDQPVGPNAAACKPNLGAN